MIKLPQRSVTRFFIPLIDVLTLLFCIFLLLPLVKPPEEEAEAHRLADELHRLQTEMERLRREGGEVPEDLRQEIERLRKEKLKALLDRLLVRVLEIDPNTGKLYYRDPEKIEVRHQADARDLIERDRRDRGVAQRELYYLILYPRDRSSSYPTRDQKEQYDRWFAGVALGYDVPGAGPAKGETR